MYLNTFSGNKKTLIYSPPLGFTAFLDKLIQENNTENTGKNEENKIDNTIQELTKYKELLDNGIITEEEFALKKKQILNI